MRREKIIELIGQSNKPLSATYLAKQFHVSRQSIVGDIALLRAAGHQIIATPRGYIMNETDSRLKKTIAVRHNSSQTEEELNLFVDMGAEVEDVIVDHPLYGEISGNLHIQSRHDVALFIEKYNEEKTTLLSSLTNGIHLHTIKCDDEETYDNVRNALKEHGFLYEEAEKKDD